MLLIAVVILQAAFTLSCTFPENWRDTWITSGYGSNIQITITQNSMSTKGRCQLVSPVNNQYLLMQQQSEEDGANEICYRCLVFTLKHTNILQYKEAIKCNVPASDHPALFSGLCNRITAETPLLTLVREHAVPISCPGFLTRGRLEISYNMGNGECPSGSHIQACASSKRFLINFSECSDSTSLVERELELQCLATWRSGGGNWLYVKYKADYRCMNYDETSNLLGMTSDASCTDIPNIMLSPISMSWTSGPSLATVATGCDFTSWFTQSEWTDLQAEYNYRHDSMSNELVIDKLVHNPTSYTETSQRMTCYRQVSDSSSSDVMYITRSSKECSHGYQCLLLRRKSNLVTEIIKGKLTDDPVSACSSEMLNAEENEKRLLINNNTPIGSCPLFGKFLIKATGYSCPVYLEMGCNSPSQVTIKQCDMIKAEMVCLASWTEDGKRRLVISRPTYPRRGTCYGFMQNGTELIMLLAEDCNHGAPVMLDSPSLRLPHTLPQTERCREDFSGIQKESRTYTGDDNSETSHSSIATYTFALFLPAFHIAIKFMLNILSIF